MSTFTSGVASHDYNVQILAGNIIRWNFPNVLLVDSVRNEPASHGFVKFNIKQKSNNPDGTLIENSAGIYFDFNAPIITPPVFNTIKRPPFYVNTYIEDFNVNTIGNIKIYPNPSSELLTLTFNSDTNNSKIIQLINKEGKEISSRNFKAVEGHNSIEFKIENLTSGIYFIKITDELESKFVKFIKE